MDEKNTVKQNIIDEALKLFSAKGYEGVSVNELTEASGITKPTLYYYFGSKEGLYEAVCQSHYSLLNEVVQDNVVYVPSPKVYHRDIFLTLTKVCGAYFSFAVKNEAFYRIVLANLSMPPSSSVFKVVEKYHFIQFDLVEKMFHQMAKAHGNLKGKSKALSWSFIGTINAYIGFSFSLPDHRKRSGEVLNDREVREIVHQFMHGIYS